MDKNKTISIYGSHDASVTFIDKKGQIRIYEYERYVKKRYAMFSSQFDNRTGIGSNEIERRNFLILLKNNLYDENIENILCAGLNETDEHLINEYFPNSNFVHIGHHFSHACSGFYPSGFDKAIIISVDGGGVDLGSVAMTKIYLGNENGIHNLQCPNVDFGNPYSSVAYVISEIKPGPEGSDSRNSLAHAGKIMGLCAYGNVRQEWKQSFYKFYENGNLDELCAKLGIPARFNSVNGQTSYDLSATSQYTFETKMNELIVPYIEKYNMNVVLVGGCALNVLYNQKLHEYLEKKGLKLYVPPNPNDCGQSYGMFLSRFPDAGKKEVVYNGMEILDENNFQYYVNTYNSEEFTYKKIVNYLKQGKIIGVLNGNSEVGPRALGNRSIICDPSFAEMKDILNTKVKFREWYRPFAPVCRFDDRNKYFQNAFEAKYMSYAPKVREEYKEKLKSIVHIDDTTRLQTVDAHQHEFFYELLTELDNQNHIPVILNTSFNIKGFPILTTIEDAFHVLDNTELDFLLVKDKIFRKNI